MARSSPLALVLLGLGADAAAATYHVTTGDDAGPGSLRAAIAAAAMRPDADALVLFEVDRVTLAAPIAIEHAVTLRGGLVDGGGAAQLFRVGAEATLRLDAMRLEHGAADAGGAVALAGEHASLIADRSHFVGNSASASGGAIHAGPGTTVRIAYGTLRENVAAGPGGAIAHDGAARLDTVKLESNASEHGAGGALAAGPASTLEVDDSYFYANLAAGAGGAMQVDGALALRRSSLHSNRAMQHGGALALGADAAARDFLVANVTFDGNYAYSEDELEPQRGAALHVAAVTAGNARLVHLTVVDNVGADQIHVASGGNASVLLANSVVASETAITTACGGAALAPVATTAFPDASCGPVDVADLGLGGTRHGGWFGQAYRLPDGGALPPGDAAICASAEVGGQDQLQHARHDCTRGAVAAPSPAQSASSN